MDKRKKLSDFHNHLKRLKKQEEHDENQTELDTFLSSETFYSPNNDSDIQTLPYKINSNEIRVHEIEMEGEEPNQNRESSKTRFSSETRFSNENGDNLTGVLPFCTWEEISDWPQTLTNHYIQEIVMNGHVNRQLNSYPRNYDNRSFSSSFFCRKISNGESYPRSWQIYSEKVNKIFCFCCKLFNITDTSLARTGSVD
ncbi:zinc finger MYM-type protein 5-like [Hydra vulgaris]|uniref:Zinc finger MYM-type protein 5-like n=1 Tax=Hydra vulgaris TaxID=6087 RepID=A0ABM4CUP6_HYDVU